MKSKYWKNVNYNKWKQIMPDCQVRALCADIGVDYELACKALGVKCVPGKGFNDTYGVDLDVILVKFKKFFGPLTDMLDLVDDPVQALTNGITLNDWLEAHKKDNAKYLVYLDDDKAMDGGHIVCAYCYPDKLYFIDTFDCGEMFVQAWTKVKKVIPKDSDQHWKYDKQLKKFI